MRIMKIALGSLLVSLVLLSACTNRSDEPVTSTNPGDSPAPEQEGERFELLIHCGLSVPLEFDDRLWLPVDRRLRRTHNPPEGFGSDENYDVGTIRVIDHDTIIYTSSEGVEVEYEPTKRRPEICE